MPKVAIIGGGIGGLTTAIALLQKGIEVVVYEAGEQLREAGAGIWVPANALAVLDRLGIAKAMVQGGRVLDSIEVRDFTGALLQLTDFSAVRQHFGFGTVAIHRSVLRKILAEQLPGSALVLGKQLQSCREMSDGVGLHFEDGSEAKADLLIGADGLRSAARAYVAPGAVVRYSGQSSYRAAIPFTLLPPELDSVAWEVWGKGCRFGFSAIARDQVYWYATFDAPPGEADKPGEAVQRLRTLFQNFPGPIPRLIEASAGAPILRTDLSDLAPIRSWHSGRTVLVGDAAHATTPNLGQGGAQAIEDAWVIADALSTSADYQTAYKKFEQIRMKKADKVTRLSRQLGHFAHLRNPLSRGLRNLVLRAIPRSVNQRQVESLYSLNY